MQNREEENARNERARAQRHAQQLAEIQRKKERLLHATNCIISGSFAQEDLTFILTELHDWKKMLIKRDASWVRYFLDHIASFPIKLKRVLPSILPVLKLKIFEFSDGLVSYPELNRLLVLVKSTFLLFGIKTDTLLTAKLILFVVKINDDTVLDDKEVFCLQRIIEDYQVGLLGEHHFVDNIVVNQLLGSTTLSQLNPKPKISEGSTINPQNFLSHHAQLAQRIASLPLNEENREHINLIILPGILSIIRDEQVIVDHVTANYGRLYYLNDKLPLHTDHSSSADPEEYRLILRNLLVSVFSSAEIAHQKGRLNQFCEKICIGYCFEGRVRDLFKWASCLSDIVSVDAVMEKYLYKEYLPYAEIMGEHADGVVADVMHTDPIVSFILVRHCNANCLHHPIYAPNGEITIAGVKKYLFDMFGLVSQRDQELYQWAIEQSNSLIRTLQEKSSSFLNYPRITIIQIKINALNALKTSLETTIESPDIVTAACNIKQEHPLALSGFWSSKTKTLLDRLEADNEILSQEILSSTHL
ncbi:MAG: hypothetical protein P1U36_02285 [Legionellaceae bacterium]|nr:hypothetical protein [Legionellaceae bacterium]